MGTFYWMLQNKNVLWIIQYGGGKWVTFWVFCNAFPVCWGLTYVLHICWSILITKKKWNTHHLFYIYGITLDEGQDIIRLFVISIYESIDKPTRIYKSQVAMFCYTFPSCYSTKKIKSIFISARFGDCEDI